MTAAIDGLYRIGVRLHADEQGAVAPDALIRVFHRCIQQDLLPGLPIDVADYAHVAHQGPGVLLIGHEGNWGYGDEDGVRALCYYAKRPFGASFGERLRTVLARAVAAAAVVAAAPELDGAVRFPGRGLTLFANDRLRAPNSADAAAALEAAALAVLDALWPGTRWQVTVTHADPRARLALTVAAQPPLMLDALAGASAAA